MKPGVKCTQAFQKVQIPLTRQSRMKSANHVNLGDAELKGLARCLDNLRDGQFKGMRVAFPGPERAELAREDADVRVIDIAVQDVSGAIPVISPPNNVWDQSKRIDVGRAIRLGRLFLVYSFRRYDFIVDRAQFLRKKPGACEIFHKFNLTQDPTRIKLPANFLISGATL